MHCCQLLCSPQAMFPCLCSGTGPRRQSHTGHGFSAEPREPHPAPSSEHGTEPSTERTDPGRAEAKPPPGLPALSAHRDWPGTASAWPGPLHLTLALPASSLRLRASSCASMRRPGCSVPRPRRHGGGGSAASVMAAQGRSPPAAAPATPRGAELCAHWPERLTHGSRQPMRTGFFNRAPPTRAKWLLG